MKFLVQLVLWVVIAFLGYKVYDSVYSSVRFQQVKEARFAEVVTKLKDIRKAQLAHKTVNGTFATSFENLTKFIDTAKFQITQRRDSSFTRFDKSLRIDRSIDTVVVDILGYESVKDSLFKNSDRYTKLNEVKVIENKTADIKLETGVITKNEIDYPVFKASVAKKDILFDQDETYITEEEQANSLDEINGPEIYVGSMDEINTNGNWPIVYDK